MDYITKDGQISKSKVHCICGITVISAIIYSAKEQCVLMANVFVVWPFKLKQFQVPLEKDVWSESSYIRVTNGNASAYCRSKKRELHCRAKAHGCYAFSMTLWIDKNNSYKHTYVQHQLKHQNAYKIYGTVENVRFSIIPQPALIRWMMSGLLGNVL